MTRNTITDITRITQALDLTGAIESYLWDELTDGNYWHSIEDIARQLETASCANGSWSQMIYTRDILNRLSDPDWQDDIDEALGSYADAVGESPDITTLESMVIFAVDWVAYELAGKLRHLGKVWIVTASSDTLDPSPDVIAFDDESEALDWVADEVEGCVQYRVDHSPYSVTEADREAMTEVEAALLTITEEAI
tara:strand:- start:451 stop:1035 length:585 start_codon:yes stop_codon:yes gene_type:complete